MEEEKNEDSQLTTAELIWCLVIGSLLGVILGLYLVSIRWHIYVKITINIAVRNMYNSLNINANTSVNTLKVTRIAV